MTEASFETSASGLQTAARRIVHRTKGHAHGPVTRLMSPGDLGQTLKPFVFLDLFKIDPSVPTRFGMHPHSGIATLTALVAGEMHYFNRDGEPGSLFAGGIEWMMAGGGVWHGSPLSSPAHATGFQLWVALPPGLEDAPSEEIFVGRDDIPVVGPARVLLGDYKGARNRVTAPSAMTYLHVTLKAGERWVFEPPMHHVIAWIALNRGVVNAGETIGSGELASFETGSTPLTFHALEDSSFVLGSAVPHPHPLVTGNYSVHTNSVSLVKGERKIVELGSALRRAGRLS